jgi:hypothetical protein
VSRTRLFFVGFSVAVAAAMTIGMSIASAGEDGPGGPEPRTFNQDPAGDPSGGDVSVEVEHEIPLSPEEAELLQAQSSQEPAPAARTPRTAPATQTTPAVVTGPPPTVGTGDSGLAQGSDTVTPWQLAILVALGGFTLAGAALSYRRVA